MVVPFRGNPTDLEDLCQRLKGLELRQADTLAIVNNTPGGDLRPPGDDGRIRILRASERAAPGFARNRGAAQGTAEWLVFFDADTEPVEDLLDRYFDPAPHPRTALLGGGVIDEPVPEGAPPAARYAYLRRLMSQSHSFRMGKWSYPKTANAAVRRAAFEAAGGFRDDIRAGEDAELTYRLKAAGWEVERREGAAVVHRGRRTVRGFITQKALHGAGGAWLERRYPGSFPARRRPGLVWWAVRAMASGLISAARRRDRDKAVWAVFLPLEELSFEFGRSLSNQRSRRQDSLPRRLHLVHGTKRT